MNANKIETWMQYISNTCVSELKQRKSFEEFQKHFINAFRQPSETAKGNEGFYNYAWQFNNVQIVHYVFDRFEPEEHVRIKKEK